MICSPSILSHGFIQDPSLAQGCCPQVEDIMSYGFGVHN